jgi:3-oxoacyl-[acyl-carrier protein] reductase
MTNYGSESTAEYIYNTGLAYIRHFKISDILHRAFHTHCMASPPSRRPLENKVAIVTGSSRSIGASIARRLAADGADVIINFHRIAAEAERTAHSINSMDGGRAFIVKADVSTVEGGRFLLEECVRLVGIPDILVLNAGFMGSKPLAEVDELDFDAHINTNVKGPLFMIQAASEILQTGTLDHQENVLRS